MAREGGAQTINMKEQDVRETLLDMTAGRGPDSCIEAVGMEAHGGGWAGAYDKIKVGLFQETGRPIALRQAIMSCRNGGTLSIAGVFGGMIDKVPIGSIMNRSLTVKTGQTHVQRYLKPLLERVEKGEIDPSFVITHTLPLNEAKKGYDMFKDKEHECIKVVLKP